MKIWLDRLFCRAAFTSLLFFPLLAVALPASDGAYLRLFLAQDKNHPSLAVNLVIDGKLAQPGLIAGQINPYIELTPGQHELALHLAGQAMPVRGLTVALIPGSALTVALNNLLPDTSPLLFSDPLPEHRRQTRLNVYHLDVEGLPVDVLTNKGGRIFSSLVPGAQATQVVNPIRVEISMARSGQILSLAERTFVFSPGRSHSIFFMPEAGRSNRMAIGIDVFPDNNNDRP